MSDISLTIVSIPAAATERTRKPSAVDIFIELGGTIGRIFAIAYVAPYQHRGREQRGSSDADLHGRDPRW